MGDSDDEAFRRSKVDVGATFRSPDKPGEMPGHLPTRKRIRLAPETYRDPAAFSVTVSTSGRRALFHDGGAVALCVEALGQAAIQVEMAVLAYCFMPDHVHLLLQGTEGSDLIRFMKAFKQLSGYHYRQAYKRRLWQKGYYDHILRREEDVASVAEYIVQNPLRAGLVGKAEDYPFVGGALLKAASAGDLKVAPTPAVPARSAGFERGTSQP